MEIVSLDELRANKTEELHELEIQGKVWRIWTTEPTWHQWNTVMSSFVNVKGNKGPDFDIAAYYNEIRKLCVTRTEPALTEPDWLTLGVKAGSILEKVLPKPGEFSPEVEKKLEEELEENQ